MGDRTKEQSQLWLSFRILWIFSKQHSGLVIQSTKTPVALWHSSHPSTLWGSWHLEMHYRWKGYKWDLLPYGTQRSHFICLKRLILPHSYWLVCLCYLKSLKTMKLWAKQPKVLTQSPARANHKRKALTNTTASLHRWIYLGLRHRKCHKKRQFQKGH